MNVVRQSEIAVQSLSDEILFPLLVDAGILQRSCVHCVIKLLLLLLYKSIAAYHLVLVDEVDHHGGSDVVDGPFVVPPHIRQEEFQRIHVALIRPEMHIEEFDW